VERSVIIDCFPERARRYGTEWTIVAVDVLRASTTLLTAAVTGVHCHPAASLDDAVALAADLPGAVVAGELAGSVPYGFELDNSPVAIVEAELGERPLVLLSTAGTPLICHPPEHQSVYSACLRNWSAQSRCLQERHEQVALIGAGARGEFRPEDALCCAWIAADLVAHGYRPQNQETVDVMERWRRSPPDAIRASPSAEYLRTTGRARDIEFVLDHVDDVDAVLRRNGNRMCLEPCPRAPRDAA
jgi:2-phosphosulfolactate phosphatase